MLNPNIQLAFQFRSLNEEGAMTRGGGEGAMTRGGGEWPGTKFEF